MKNLYCLSTALFCAITFAQTTITKTANDYLVGDSVNEFNLAGTPDNSATGSGVTFNNSALTNGSAITATVTAPSAAEIGTFPSSNIKFSDGNGNDLFYKSTSTMLEITGATIGGGVLNFNADNAIFLKFPTAFGNTYADTARGTATFSGTTVLIKGTIGTNADASGTLMLGTQSFPNILRVVTVQNYNLYLPFDITYSNSIGTITSTIYTYYDNVRRYPVFTSTSALILVPLASINQSINTSIGLSTIVLGTNNNSIKNKIEVYPNPVNENLFLAGDLQGFDEVKIYNMEGRLVKTQNAVDAKMNLQDLPAGNYILQLSGKNKNAQSIRIMKN